MRRILTAAALSMLLLNLGGCVLAVGNDGDSGSESSWSSSDADSNLAHAVRSSLNSDPQTRDADILVSADHGRITLKGTVRSTEVLAKAVQLALDMPDVKSVHSNVTVIK